MGKRAFVGMLIALSSWAVPVIAEPLPGVRVWQVTPRIGRPQGGQIVRIAGSGFQPPIRVFFDLGGGQTIEAFVISVTDTRVEVLTPAVLILPPAQSRNASIVLVNQAGTPREDRVSAGDFLFLQETLTPRIHTATPNSGPFTGGTRVTIFGDGFQAPVQVLFGSVEARVLWVELNQILVESPVSQDLGPVPIRIWNINSDTSSTLEDGFRYAPNLAITSITPRSGPDSGGTSVTIDGVGFLPPAAVTVAGVDATVLRITGTSILARTSPLRGNACAHVTGPVVVTNIVNGDSNEGPTFTYIPAKPAIVRVEPKTVAAGDRVHVSVVGLERNKGRFTIGQRAVVPISVRTVGAVDEYELVVPPLDLRSVPCRISPLFVELTVTNIDNGCATSERALVMTLREDPCRPDRGRQ